MSGAKGTALTNFLQPCRKEKADSAPAAQELQNSAVVEEQEQLGLHELVGSLSIGCRSTLKWPMPNPVTDLLLRFAFPGAQPEAELEDQKLFASHEPKLFGRASLPW